MFNIVLVEPEIPQNTGNIIRTAAATGCKVHLVKPLGFDISDKALKRAGLDYWHLTDFEVYENLTDFFEKTLGQENYILKNSQTASVAKTGNGAQIDNIAHTDSGAQIDNIAHTGNGAQIDNIAHTGSCALIDNIAQTDSGAQIDNIAHTGSGEQTENSIQTNKGTQTVNYENAIELKCNSVDSVAPHFYFCSTKAQLRYDEVKYQDGDYLLFGRETRGLPEELLHENYKMTVRIPMVADARSLNLSNSVAIVVYEGMRQCEYKSLLTAGHLTRF